MKPDSIAPTPPSVGVFDSGIGGLSILSEIRRAAPSEHVLYVADSRHAPYGEKTSAFIQDRSEAIVKFLLESGAKAVVVACNTATAVAVDYLRTVFSAPIVAVEPPIKPAVSLTKSGVVGVLATSQTVASERFATLTRRFGDGARLVIEACPGLAEHVEEGELSGQDTQRLVDRYVRPLLDQNADTIVLGCTHYAFLIPAIRRAAGPDVTIVDPAPAVANELVRRLARAELASPIGDAQPTERFFTSGPTDVLQSFVMKVCGRRVDVSSLPEAYCIAP
jgi:glutamate racemase